MALQPTADQKVDRQNTTPFLLRLYYRANAFHSPSEFHTVPPAASLQQSSLQIYTWPTCTISELTTLLTSALPSLVPSPAVGTRVGYRLVFPDTRSINSTGGGSEDSRGRWLSKDLGSVVIGEQDEDHDMALDGEDAPAATRPSKFQGDAEKTLADARFVIGDYISCAIFPPLADGSVAPLPPADRGYPAGGRFGGPPGGYGRGGYGGRAENGYGGGGYGASRGGGGFGGPRGGRGGFAAERGFGGPGVPNGDWRRGERIPEGPSGNFGRGRGRGRPY